MSFRLTGRAIVELTIERGDGTAFSPEAGGEPRKTAVMQVRSEFSNICAEITSLRTLFECIQFPSIEFLSISLLLDGCRRLLSAFDCRKFRKNGKVLKFLWPLEEITCLDFC